MIVQHLHSVAAAYETAMQHLHSLVAVCETAMQPLHSLAAVCETAMQPLHSLAAVCETAMQPLHSVVAVCETAMQPLHSLVAVCAPPLHAPGKNSPASADAPPDHSSLQDVWGANAIRPYPGYNYSTYMYPANLAGVPDAPPQRPSADAP